MMSWRVVEEGLFFFMGVGTLLPWNAFITESSYYQERFDGAWYEDTFESAFGICYNVSNLVMLVLLLWVQQFVAERVLIIGPFLCTGAIFCITAILALLDISSDVLFALTLSCVILCGLLAGPMIAGVAGFSAGFPVACQSAFFSGQAFAGVVASLTSLITTWVSPMKDDFCNHSGDSTTVSVYFQVLQEEDGDGQHQHHDPDSSAFSYFIVAAAVCLLCIVAYQTIHSHQKSHRLYVQLERQNRADIHFRESLSSDGEVEVGLHDLPMGENTEMDVETSSEQRERRNGENSIVIEHDEEDEDDDLHLTLEEYHRRYLNLLPDYESWDFETLKLVSLIMAHPCLAVLLTYWFTLTVFPAVTSETESTKKCEPGASRFFNDLYVPFLFLLFNLSDLLGRIMQGIWQPLTGRQLFIGALCRVLFLPLFWFMNVKESRLTVLFNHDAFPPVISFLCGFSNGYIGTASMVYASRLLPKHHRDVASTISLIALTVGLGLGSSSSFFSIWVIQG